MMLMSWPQELASASAVCLVLVVEDTGVLVLGTLLPYLAQHLRFGTDKPQGRKPVDPKGGSGRANGCNNTLVQTACRLSSGACSSNLQVRPHVCESCTLTVLACMPHTLCLFMSTVYIMLMLMSPMS